MYEMRAQHQLQTMHAAAAADTEAAVADAEARRRRSWLIMARAMQGLGGALTLQQWRYEVDTLETSPRSAVEWPTIEADLDLSSALTLNVTASAQLLQDPAHKKEQGWTFHRELRLFVWVQDTLDGSTWHTLCGTTLTPAREASVIRVIDALGARCRIQLCLEQVIARKRTSDGVVETRDRATTYQPEMAAENVKVIIATRTTP